MTHVRLSTFAATVGLLLFAIGCSHPLEVDVPTGYMGKVTVLCQRFSEDGRPIRVDADGFARNAVCPRSRQKLTVVRDGKAVATVGDAHWSSTGDGILLAFDFDVQ